MIHSKCEHCGASFKADVDRAGSSVACPQCGKQTGLPQSESQKQTELLQRSVDITAEQLEETRLHALRTRRMFERAKNTPTYISIMFWSSVISGVLLLFYLLAVSEAIPKDWELLVVIIVGAALAYLFLRLQEGITTNSRKTRQRGDLVENEARRGP